MTISTITTEFSTGNREKHAVQYTGETGYAFYERNETAYVNRLWRYSLHVLSHVLFWVLQFLPTKWLQKSLNLCQQKRSLINCCNLYFNCWNIKFIHQTLYMYYNSDSTSSYFLTWSSAMNTNNPPLAHDTCKSQIHTL